MNIFALCKSGRISPNFGMTCISHSVATFAFHMSKQRRIFPLGLRTGTTGFSHVVFPGVGSMIKLLQSLEFIRYLLFGVVRQSAYGLLYWCDILVDE